MNASFSIIGVLILAILAAIPLILWRVSAAWHPWLKIPARLFSALFGLFVLWVVIVNTLFFIGVEH